MSPKCSWNWNWTDLLKLSISITQNAGRLRSRKNATKYENIGGNGVGRLRRLSFLSDLARAGGVRDNAGGQPPSRAQTPPWPGNRTAPILAARVRSAACSARAGGGRLAMFRVGAGRTPTRTLSWRQPRPCTVMCAPILVTRSKQFHASCRKCPRDKMAAASRKGFALSVLQG